MSFFAWCAVQGFVASPPTAGLTPLKGSGDAHRFQTLTEIEAVVARGGLDAAEEWALWDRLYLTPPEVGEVLDLARTRSRRGVSHVLHAVPAYTGMRRGEVLRLRWSDVDFEHRGVVARSRKQSRQAAETSRRIDLHPDLEAILLDWRGRRTRGQFVACDEGSTEPPALHQAAERFAQPLKDTRWAILERGHLRKLGYHTDRHSIASNLAAGGGRVVLVPDDYRGDFFDAHSRAGFGDWRDLMTRVGVLATGTASAGATAAQAVAFFTSPDGFPNSTLPADRKSTPRSPGRTSMLRTHVASANGSPTSTWWYGTPPGACAGTSNA